LLKVEGNNLITVKEQSHQTRRLHNNMSACRPAAKTKGGV
jgi:hypothetical protein